MRRSLRQLTVHRMEHMSLQLLAGCFRPLRLTRASSLIGPAQYIAARVFTASSPAGDLFEADLLKDKVPCLQLQTLASLRRSDEEFLFFLFFSHVLPDFQLIDPNPSQVSRCFPRLPTEFLR